jgi:hypothetical protein
MSKTKYSLETKLKAVNAVERPNLLNQIFESDGRNKINNSP